MSASEPLILGIETSCDETGIGIVRGRTLLANEIASSVNEHARYGGVVPEVAARAHLEAFYPTLDRALNTAKIKLSDLDAIAVTRGPGLAGPLLVGTGAATGLASGLNIPIYGVNHLAAHIAVDALEREPVPTIALLVSGGHSSILEVRDINSDIRQLGATFDDAAGEAFDKIARILGLPFPGGPHLDRLARDGDGAAIEFPRGMTLFARRLRLGHAAIPSRLAFKRTLPSMSLKAQKLLPVLFAASSKQWPKAYLPWVSCSIRTLLKTLSTSTLLRLSSKPLK